MLSKNACSSAALRAPAGDSLHRPAVRGRARRLGASRCRQRCDRALAVWKGRLLDRLGRARDERPDRRHQREIYQAHHAKSWAEVRAMAEEASRRTGVRARGLARDLTREDKLPDGNSRVAWMAIMAETRFACDGASVDFHLQRGSRTAITLQEATAAQLRELDDPNVAAYGVYNLRASTRAPDYSGRDRALAEACALRPQLTEWSS